MKKLFHVLAQMPPWKGGEILVFKIGRRHCSFAVTGPSGNQLYELAYYTADEINGNFLNRLSELHPELSQTFQKVLLSYDYYQNILIPAMHFKKEKASAMLKSLYGVGNGYIVITETSLENDAEALYAVPEEVHDWILSKFPSAIFVHGYKTGIKNIPNDTVAGCIRTDFGTEHFSTVVSKAGQLLLAQTFPYSAPDDVLYYLLKICQQFGFSPLEAQLIVSGLIEKQSALFHELYQYFIHINFKNADWVVNQDNEYPLHFFAFLNEIIQCES